MILLSTRVTSLGSCLKTGQHVSKILFLIPYQRYCFISFIANKNYDYNNENIAP